MFSMFGIKDNKKDVVAPVAAQTPKRTTHKKKNTYVVRPDSCAQYFSMCDSTPLYVHYLNGVEQQTGRAFVAATQFPNPAASTMVQNYNEMSSIMGDKVACTIIEYLDKDNGNPVVQVYPEYIHVFEEYKDDYKSHLNHASRADFEYQVKKRRNMLEIYHDMAR